MTDTIDGTWVFIVVGAFFGLLISYWIIRLAVRHALADAAEAARVAKVKAAAGSDVPGGGVPPWNAKPTEPN